MLVSETFLNATEGYRFGETEPFEPYTDDVGRLFRDMQRGYGRCLSSVYVDGEDGKPRRIGWVFQKRAEYEDARSDWPDDRRYYIREVWVVLHDAPDTVTRRRHYHFIG
jgi:hypothetical protein